MSSNNVVWVMPYKGYIHVFYSGCIDNTPTKPNFNNSYYKVFKDRSKALTYAHDVVSKINKESYAEGFAGVEYGVCEIAPYHMETMERIDKMINDWEQKIKDLRFSIEQFEAWKKELVNKASGGEKEVAKNSNMKRGYYDHNGKFHKIKESTDSKPPEYNRPDQCEKCIFEYTKDYFCYEGEQQTLEEKKPCELFKPKKND